MAVYFAVVEFIFNKLKLLDPVTLQSIEGAVVVPLETMFPLPVIASLLIHLILRRVRETGNSALLLSLCRH
ncbi:MAG: hypothetical protein ACKOEV_04375 [Cytophagales bacterium]